MDDKELIKFVDWLMKNEESPRGMSIEETVSWINSLSKTEDGSKLLNQLINTYKNSDMKLFKDGGKLKHLLCLKSGGKGPDCGCNKVIKGDEGIASISNPTTNTNKPWTVSDKKNRYGDVSAYANGMRYGPDYSSRGGSNPYGGTVDKLSAEQQDALNQLRLSHAWAKDPEFMKQREQRLKNPDNYLRISEKTRSILEGPQYKAISLPKGEGLNTRSVSSFEDGGEVDPYVTRRETKNVAKEGLGYTNKDFRKRYRDEKKIANGDRQKARWEIIDDVYPRATAPDIELPVLDDVVIEDVNVDLPAFEEIINVPQSLGVSIQGYSDKMDDSLGFKKAFANARRYGLDEFSWRGKRYNTKLAGPKKSTAPVESVESAEFVTSETPSYPVYIPKNKQSFKENLKASIINNAIYMK